MFENGVQKFSLKKNHIQAQIYIKTKENTIQMFWNETQTCSAPIQGGIS